MYLPKEFLDKAVTPVNAEGEDVILAGTRVARLNSEQGLGFDLAYKPGSLKEMLRQMRLGTSSASRVDGSWTSRASSRPVPAGTALAADIARR
jgi:hypothetical protein